MAAKETAVALIIQTHVDAFLLAVASSTDNFMVGITAGLSSSNHNHHSLAHFCKVNLAVAMCNASGTWIATYGGGSLTRLSELALQKLAAAVSSSSSPETYRINFSLESLLAGLAFACLAWKEYNQRENQDSGSDDDDKTKKNTISYSIALPMTLNNLAGGVAGGVLGLSPLQATLYAFLVSFGSMAMGRALAARIMTMNRSNNESEGKSATAKRVAVLIYVVLSLQSFSGV